MEIYVRGLGSCTCQERLPWHAEEPNVVKQLVWRIFANLYILYMLLLFFRFQTSPKKLSVSCDCFLFVSLFLMVSKASSWNVECLIFKYLKKYVRKISISLHSSRATSNCSTDHHIFYDCYDCSCLEYNLFFRFLIKVNLWSF